MLGLHSGKGLMQVRDQVIRVEFTCGVGSGLRPAFTSSAKRPSRAALSASANRWTPARIWRGSNAPKLRSRPGRESRLRANLDTGVTSTSWAAAARDVDV